MTDQNLNPNSPLSSFNEPKYTNLNEPKYTNLNDSKQSQNPDDSKQTNLNEPSNILNTSIDIKKLYINLLEERDINYYENLRVLRQIMPINIYGTLEYLSGCCNIAELKLENLQIKNATTQMENKIFIADLEKKYPNHNNKCECFIECNCTYDISNYNFYMNEINNNNNWLKQEISNLEIIHDSTKKLYTFYKNIYNKLSLQVVNILNYFNGKYLNKKITVTFINDNLNVSTDKIVKVLKLFTVDITKSNYNNLSYHIVCTDLHLNLYDIFEEYIKICL